MNIGIIGGGVVGKATAKAWIGHCDSIRVWDVLPTLSTYPLKETVQSNIVFVCLPENSVEQFFGSLWMEERTRNYILKSTVPIGTTRFLSENLGYPNLLHCPEFLTERTADWDAKYPRLLVIGKPGGWNSMDEYCDHPIFQKLTDRFTGIPVMPCSSDESEAMKLIMNGFFATKVAFFNEVHALCEKLNLDWELIRDGLIMEGRVNVNHTDVPGPDGKYGFGGKCLPKDLQQLSTEILSRGLYATMCGAAMWRNGVDRERGEK